MQLIAEKLGRTDKLDRLRFRRADGSETHTAMPRQGILPHDLVHYIVESALPLRHGFLGQIAAGADAGFVMQAVHDAGNADVATEAIQVEAVVEALQTQLWSGVFDAEAFAEGVRGACAARGRPVPVLASIDAREHLFNAAMALNERWNQVGYFNKLALDFRSSELEQPTSHHLTTTRDAHQSRPT